MTEYRTLEQDLQECFEKRKIRVQKIVVAKGGRRYVIDVIR